MSERIAPARAEQARYDLDRMLADVQANPVARKAFEDAQQREDLLLEMVRARGQVTQKEVAALMGTTQSAVSDIENGRVDPRLSTLQRYAQAVHRRLQVSVESAFGDETSLFDETAAIGSDYTLAKVLTMLVRQEPLVGPQSSAELAEQIGLPQMPVEAMVSRLRQTGWVTAVQDDDTDAPRFSLRDDRGLMIGVSLNHSHAEGVLTNLRATEVVSQERRPLPSTAPDDVMDTVVELVQELRGRCPDGHDVVGLGVGLAGLVDGPTGTVILAPDLQTADGAWRHVALEAILQDRTELRTAVENDANVLAMHEYLLQGEDQNLITVLISRSGEGIGGGLVINGALVHGVGGVGGEIGHVVVDPAGKPCRCTRDARGCLETVASPASILQFIAEHGGKAPQSLRQAASRVRRGDRVAAEAFLRAGNALGKAVSDVISLAGPRRVVIYGPKELVGDGTASAELFLSGVRTFTDKVAFDIKVDVVAKVLRGTSESAAAAATAVHYFLARPRIWLPNIAGTQLANTVARGRSRPGLTPAGDQRQVADSSQS